jgi:glycine/D-amino acid oxidase-like deaminating enzyme/nitrite reductase/ring-hydroxylating ferredoxin subunit
VDVAIVGAGITGVTAALLLARAGRSVAVLEARRIGEGVTGRTTAHLTEALDTRYTSLISSFGEEGARLAARSARSALHRIALFVDEESIQCEFEQLPGYLFTEDPEQVGELEEEADAARRAGLLVTLVRESALPFPIAGALRFEDQAQFHPRRYLFSLGKAFVALGGRIFEHTAAHEIVEGEPCRIVTDRGTVTASDVIVAANVPLNKLLLQTKLGHYQSYVLALETGGAPPPAGLFWDTHDPYHYLRVQSLDGHELLLVGGEDHKTGQEQDTEAPYRRLLEYSRSRFEVRAVRYRWSDQVIETVDGLPYIGANPLSSRVYAATGYSGTGMTFGTLAAVMLSDAVLGIENPWKELYDATRVKPLVSVQDYVAENVDFPKHFLMDRLRSPEGESLTRVGVNEGKILDLEGERVAVFRDERGELHCVSPVCTHLKCIVSFNVAEKTWDCPCHGSRFDVDGAVLNGPATMPLGPWRPDPDTFTARNLSLQKESKS